MHVRRRWDHEVYCTVLDNYGVAHIAAHMNYRLCLDRGFSDAKAQWDISDFSHPIFAALHLYAKELGVKSSGDFIDSFLSRSDYIHSISHLMILILFTELIFVELKFTTKVVHFSFILREVPRVCPCCPPLLSSRTSYVQPLRCVRGCNSQYYTIILTAVVVAAAPTILLRMSCVCTVSILYRDQAGGNLPGCKKA